MIQTLDVNPDLAKAQNAEAGASKFCPGCGHGMILKTLAHTLDDLNLQEKAVFGCDIGCSLLSWNYMNVDSVQTHHGRTTPVIYGVTRANPGTIGIAYMGDGGGLAIGSQHLVNAAVRGENMLIVLATYPLFGSTIEATISAPFAGLPVTSQSLPYGVVSVFCPGIVVGAICPPVIP